MKTFRVYAEYTSRCYIDIEAESAEEANRIAEEADGGEFIDDPTACGDWHICDDFTTEI